MLRLLCALLAQVIADLRRVANILSESRAAARPGGSLNGPSSSRRGMQSAAAAALAASQGRPTVSNQLAMPAGPQPPVGPAAAPAVSTGTALAPPPPSPFDSAAPSPFVSTAAAAAVGGPAPWMQQQQQPGGGQLISSKAAPPPSPFDAPGGGQTISSAAPPPPSPFGTANGAGQAVSSSLAPLRSPFDSAGPPAAQQQISSAAPPPPSPFGGGGVPAAYMIATSAGAGVGAGAAAADGQLSPFAARSPGGTATDVTRPLDMSSMPSTVLEATASMEAGRAALFGQGQQGSAVLDSIDSAEYLSSGEWVFACLPACPGESFVCVHSYFFVCAAAVWRQ